MKKNKCLIAIVILIILVIVLGVAAAILAAMPRSGHVVSGDQETQEQLAESLKSIQTIASSEETVGQESLKKETTEENTTSEESATEETTDSTDEKTTTEKTTTESTRKEESTTDKEDTNSEQQVVVIDAGHQAQGDSEKEPIGPGASEMKAKVASGAEGEYEINLQVSLKLREELESRGYQTIMVRETNDVNISNKERAEIANKAGGIFIRIHCNDDNSSSPKGALTICGTSSNPYCPQIYQQSRKLSEAVLNGLCAATGAKNRGVMETDTMSGINWCTVPVTIVEMGFLSNAEENKLLHDDSYQSKLAKGIADGVDTFIGDE